MYTMMLTFRDYYTMQVQFDSKWFKWFFIALVMYLSTIIMLLPRSWKGYNINWLDVSISMALVVLLIVDNSRYFDWLFIS